MGKPYIIGSSTTEFFNAEAFKAPHRSLMRKPKTDKVKIKEPIHLRFKGKR